MSADGSIEFLWADGLHRFRLAIGQLRELQDKCAAGPAQIMGRLADQTWRIDDIRETIRLGLIGGGKIPIDALTLTIRYVDARPWMENREIAFLILQAAVIGVGEDQPTAKKQDTAPTTATRDGSAFETSTTPAAH
jgi:Phage tail tube protein, GTA-gp10